MIEAVELEKSFGAVRAVRGVSFSVDRGEALGFLGPNGAGKTTTFRMLAGTIGPTSGTVRLGGKELHEDPIRAKRLLGYMPENPPLYPELTALEYLAYRAELKGIPRKERLRSVEKAAAQAHADSMLKTRILHLSKGYRQRTALADALLGDPPILLLDEPTSGLDPNQVLEVRKLIVDLAKDHAVVLSTHVLSEVAATCTRALVIHQGRVVGEGTLHELEAQRSAGRFRMVLAADEQILEETLERVFSGLSPVASRAKGQMTIVFSLPDPKDLSGLLKNCVDDGVHVLEAAPVHAALDDVFAALTRDGGRD